MARLTVHATQRFARFSIVLFVLLSLLVSCGNEGVEGEGEGSPRQPSGAAEEAGADSDRETPGRTLNEIDPRADGTFQIVATTTQAADIIALLTEGVAGVAVTALMGAGVDPHLYQPTEGDVAAMNEADMIVYSGLNLEGQFDTVFEALRDQEVLIYELSRPVRRAGFVIGSFDQELSRLGTDDPHFWFDPRNWQITVNDLAETLASFDPTGSEGYLANAAEYAEGLDLLYDWADRGMRSVPGGLRYLVTSHDAFQYFGAAFGWRMASIQGISTEDEAGVGDVQETVAFVIDNEIPVLFVESSIPPDTIEAVEEAIASEGGEVRLGVRELYSDAMGEPGTFAGTYVGMIAENVLTILQSYRCAGVDVEIPQWPDGLDPAPPRGILDVSCD
ncbi:MAG: metal ABC transporter solute-binding protein, Zn/Mn family [Spirochaetaceae bacterium]